MSNRVIKFRAWLTDCEKMVNVYVLDQTGDAGKGTHFKTSKGFVEGDALGNQYLFNIDNAILMQFTGFQDASGIDLYDGDLLSLSETKYTYEIRWEHGAWICYHWNTSFESRWGPLSRFFDPDFSKYYINRIGNIHQNPKA